MADFWKYCADTWIKIIKFDTLEKLEVRNCAGADALFAQLSKPHLRPSRLRSLRWMDDDKSEPHALEAFEGLLESMSGLETLHMYVSRMRALPKISSILCHKKTLTSLSIYSQYSKSDIFAYSEDDYRRLCTEATEIKQLSLMFPKTNAENALPAPEFENFLVSALERPSPRLCCYMGFFYCLALFIPNTNFRRIIRLIIR